MELCQIFGFLIICTDFKFDRLYFKFIISCSNKNLEDARIVRITMDFLKMIGYKKQRLMLYRVPNSLHFFLLLFHRSESMNIIEFDSLLLLKLVYHTSHSLSMRIYIITLDIPLLLTHPFCKSPQKIYSNYLRQ